MAAAMVKMAVRICVLCLFPLVRISSSEDLRQDSGPVNSLLLARYRRLQYKNQYQGYNNNGYNSGAQTSYNNAAGASSNYNTGADNGHYTYPGQNAVGQGNYGNAQPLTNQYQGGSNYNTPFHPPGQAQVAEETREKLAEALSTTRIWRGSSVASSGSDPFDGGSSREGSADSRDSSSGSFESKASRWSSSGSGSGSGWLWPWDYKNLPWVSPYWIWWQYFMAITCFTVLFCCTWCIACVCMQTMCPLLFKTKAKPKKIHHHHSHHSSQLSSPRHGSSFLDDGSEDETEDSDESEDLEDDPHRHRQASVKSSRSNRSAYPPPLRGVGSHQMQMGAYHPQHQQRYHG